MYLTVTTDSEVNGDFEDDWVLSTTISLNSYFVLPSCKSLLTFLRIRTAPNCKTKKDFARLMTKINVGYIYFTHN